MKKLVMTLAVIVTVLLGVNFGAAAYAESSIADGVQQRLGLAQTPAVDYRGFPFLYHAVAGRYPAVAVRAEGIEAGQLSDLGVDLVFQDVRAPVAQVVSGSVGAIPVGRVTGTVRIPESGIGRLTGVPDLRIAPVGPAAPAASARVSGSVVVGGIDAAFTVVTDLGVQDRRVVLSPRDLEIHGVPVPNAVEDALLGRFSVPLDLSSLPFDVVLTGLRVVDGAVVVEAAATDVVLNENAVPSG